MRADSSRVVVFNRKTTMSQSVNPNCTPKARTPPKCSPPPAAETKEAEVDIKVLELEKRIQSLNFGADKNIKVEATEKTEETDEEVESLTKGVKSLEVNEEGEEGSDAEDDRIPRGPDRNQRVSHLPSAPYEHVKPSPSTRLHHSGGQLVSSNVTQYLHQDVGPSFSMFPPPLASGGLPSSIYLDQTHHNNLAGDIGEFSSISSGATSGCLATVSSLPITTTTFVPQDEMGYLFQDLSGILDESSNSTLESIDDIVQEMLPLLPELVVGNMPQSEIEFLVNALEKNNGTTEEETYIAPTPPGVNIPQPSYNTCPEYAINSVGSSSGYESSSSTPSNSPGPNNSSNSPPNQSILNTYTSQNLGIDYDDIPVTVQEISSNSQIKNNTPGGINQKKYCPILPKPISTFTMQEKFYKYIVCLAKSEQAVKRIIGVIFKNDLSLFTAPDIEGDTALIKLVANPTAVALEASSGANFLQSMSRNPQVVRLAVVYAVVQRLDMESSVTLKDKNFYKQSALHLAAINSPEHPLIAAYIAETMHKHGYNLNERCEDSQCEAGGTLLHCLARRGDSHAAVLGELLKVSGAFKVDAVDNKYRMTPLQLAIKSIQTHLHDVQGPLRVHKTVDVLIKNGASLKDKEKNATPLQMVLQMTLETGQGPDMDLLKVLLNNPRNEVNTADIRSLRPIHYAAQLTHKLPINIISHVMKLLVHHGASVRNDVNTQFTILNMVKDDMRENVRHLLFPLQRNQSM